MDRTRTVLTVASVPLLGGCMTSGGLGHHGEAVVARHAWHVEEAEPPAALHDAEASDGGLTIELSFPTRTVGDPVVLRARLRGEGPDDEVADGDVWLRLETPGGGVDWVHMEPVPSPEAGMYGARYGFLVPGRYLVTAEGRMGAAADARTVSVTTAAEIAEESYHHDDRDRIITSAVLGALGMVVMMVVMMGAH